MTTNLKTGKAFPLLAAGVLLGTFALGGWVGSYFGPAPAECVAAIDTAESMIGVHEDVAASAGSAVGYAADWDSAGLDRETEKINGYAEELDDLRPVYLDAAEACRG